MLNNNNLNYNVTLNSFVLISNLQTLEKRRFQPLGTENNDAGLVGVMLSHKLLVAFCLPTL